MDPEINGLIEKDKQNKVKNSGYCGSNKRFLEQIFHSAPVQNPLKQQNLLAEKQNPVFCLSLQGFQPAY